jgi:hypothetical protein
VGQYANVQFLQFSARLGQGTLVPASDDKVASFVRQRAGNGKSDAAVGSANEG